jgi:DNA-binding beta-propeller fold protein YncE
LFLVIIAALSTIPTSAQQVTATIKGEGYPTTAAVNPVTNRIYVCNLNENYGLGKVWYS